MTKAMNSLKSFHMRFFLLVCRLCRSGARGKCVRNGIHSYHTGKLFEGRFRRKPVEDACYFVTLVRYIHQNPQRHGLVDDSRDWPFSSYGAVLSDRPTRVQRQTVLDWFDGRAGFLEAHERAVDETAIEELLFD